MVEKRVPITITMLQKWIDALDKLKREGVFTGVYSRGGVVEKLVEQAYEVAQNRDFETKLHGKETDK